MIQGDWLYFWQISFRPPQNFQRHQSQETYQDANQVKSQKVNPKNGSKSDISHTNARSIVRKDLKLKPYKF